jgi:hypothetical protein
MTSVEKNEPIDMNQLLNLVTSINLN